MSQRWNQALADVFLFFRSGGFDEDGRCLQIYRNRLKHFMTFRNGVGGAVHAELLILIVLALIRTLKLYILLLFLYIMVISGLQADSSWVQAQNISATFVLH